VREKCSNYFFKITMENIYKGKMSIKELKLKKFVAISLKGNMYN